MSDPVLNVTIAATDQFTPTLQKFQAQISKTAAGSSVYNQQLKLMAQGVDGVAARMSTVTSGAAKWEEGLRKLQAQTVAMTASTAEFGERGHAGLRKVENAVGNLALGAVGLEGPLGKIVEGFGAFALGGPLSAAILAGLGAIAFGLDKITQQSRRAMEAYDSLRDAWAQPKELAVVGAAMDALQHKIDNMRGGVLGAATRFTRWVLAPLGIGVSSAEELKQELDEAGQLYDNFLKARNASIASKGTTDAIDLFHANVARTISIFGQGRQGPNDWRDLNEEISTFDTLIKNARTDLERFQLTNERKALWEAAHPFVGNNGPTIISRSNSVPFNDIDRSANNPATLVDAANAAKGANGILAGVGKVAEKADDSAKKFTTLQTAIAGLGTAWLEMIQSFAKSPIDGIRKFVGGFARMLGEMYVKEGFAKIAASGWPPNPLALATGLKEVAAGTALALIGGSGGGGGGGGGGSASSVASGQTAAQQQGTLTIVAPKSQSPRDADWLDFLARSLREAGSTRRIQIVPGMA